MKGRGKKSLNSNASNYDLNCDKKKCVVLWVRVMCVRNYQINFVSNVIVWTRFFTTFVGTPPCGRLNGSWWHWRWRWPTNDACLYILTLICCLTNANIKCCFYVYFISLFSFFANKLNFLRDRQTNGLMLVGFCTFLVVSSYDDYIVLHYIFVNIYIMRLVSYVIIYPSLVNLKYIIYLIIYLEINYIYDVISNLGGLV